MPYTERGGVKTYYETYGQGVPIVFLHPFATNGYVWHFQIFPFAQTNQVVVIDERGHGRSDKPQQGYAIIEIARDVATVLDDLKIDKAILVGNSMGGMILMQFNLDYPDRVLGNLILSSGTGLAEDRRHFYSARCGLTVEAFGKGLCERRLSAKTKAERAEVVDWVNSCFLVESTFPRHVFTASVQDPRGCSTGI